MNRPELDAISFSLYCGHIDRLGKRIFINRLVTTGAGNEVGLTAPDRVASGRYRPEAPTDPYVLALEHTVLQIMSSLPFGTQRGYPFLFR